MTTPRSQDLHPAPPSPDHQQAQHLRAMLTEQAEELDATLVTYGAALDRYLQRGEHTQARRVRGLIRNAERERRSVQQMMARLEVRFGAAPHEHRSDHAPNHADAHARRAARVRPHPSPHRVIRA